MTGADGGYTIEMSATGNNGMVELVHSSHLTLDNTPPAITIVEPTAADYPHSAVLTLDYSASDGLGSGVASLTAMLDGSSTLAGHGLGDGQAINLLFELSLGEHTFVVNSQDRVQNGSQARQAQRRRGSLRRGNCAKAANLYGAFIKLLQAQAPAHVDATATAIMIADAQYLISHCP